nr:XkdX family protein [uncultured Ruminococcus sp.]
MSKHFKKVKGYYDSGLWNLERVRNAVVKGWITAEEFKIITLGNYETDE